MNILTIAHLTFHEARRRKVVTAALVLGVAFLALFGVALNFLAADVRSPAAPNSPFSNPNPLLQEIGARAFLEFFAMAGLYAVNFLIVMMAILTPVDTLSGEIASGAIQSLVTKPVARREVVLGKWLGFWLLAMGYLALMAGGVVLIARAIGGVNLSNVPLALALMALEATVLLSVVIAGGTRLSTLANGVMAFGLFGLTFIGGWVEQIGALMNNQTAQNIGVVTSLILPTEALWRMAAYNLQSPLMRELFITPFAAVSAPTPAMVVWAVGYVVAALGIGLRLFGSRDL